MPAGLQLPAVSVPQSLCQQQQPKLNAPKGEFQNFLQCMLLSYVRKFNKAITVLKIFGYQFSTKLNMREPLKKYRSEFYILLQLAMATYNFSNLKFIPQKL